MGLMRRLGLLLFSAIFVVGGWQQYGQPTGRADQARTLGLPIPDRLVQLSGLAMIAAALGIQVDRLRRLSAAFLAVQLIPVTIVGHRFWELDAGPQRNQQRTHFLKNLTTIGAALLIAATEPPEEPRWRRPVNAMREKLPQLARS
jgi:uncharacterized membrane protein YphA (DoxX/SURF4 family)